jgi:hypothetical protein
MKMKKPQAASYRLQAGKKLRATSFEPRARRREEVMPSSIRAAFHPVEG